MIRYLRKLGRDRIQERINAFKNNEHMPDDILSSILNSFSKLFTLFGAIYSFLNRIILVKMNFKKLKKLKRVRIWTWKQWSMIL